MDANARHLLAQLRQNPLDFSALDALRQHCEATQSFGVWAEALEHHAHAASAADGDPIELGRLHLELGNLYRHQLSRSELALEHYRLAFDFDAAQRPAIVAARELVVELGDYEQAAELLGREAESLPAGAKRAAAWAQLASVYKTQLNDRAQAEFALREAIGDAPNDLHLQHELATLLLEDADRGGDRSEADQKRRDAADVLAQMARGVSDDYAFAYIEVALDAVPDHRESLDLLEQVAPRLGRGDALAPRWLAAIRGTQDRALARTLRLNMARAYVAVRQLADARICLDPLLAEGDAEAAEVERSLHRPNSPSQAARAGAAAPPSNAAPPHDEPSVEETLASSEILLEDEPERAPSDSLADQLGELEAQASDDEAGAPLADLAKLEREEPSEPVSDGGLSALLDAPEERSSAPHDEPQHDEPQEKRSFGRGAELDSGELAVARLDAYEASPMASSPTGAHSASPSVSRGEHDVDHEEQTAEHDDWDDQTAEHDERGGQAADAQIADRDQPRALEAADAQRNEASESARVSRATLGVPLDEDEVDPFAEETQPRAAPLTLAELTALTGGTQPRVSRVPELEDQNHEDEDEQEPKAEGEVTQITAPEDPQLTEVRSLRAELARRLRFRDRRGAAEVSETLIERGVFDAEAIEALEEHFRLTRDFRRLRDLSLLLAREQSFAPDIRATRLREAVMLSESKLGDQEGAATALRELLELEPNDAEAFDKLQRVLTRGQRWDELSDALARRADEIGDPRTKAELLRQLGALERERRDAPERAIEALARAKQLDPGHPEDDVALSELYLAAERWAEAATALEGRLAHEESADRLALLASLADLYEKRLRDESAALRTLASWRALEPRKLEPLDAVIRIHERAGNGRALLDALMEKLELSSASERGALHVRIAELALEKLDDAERAADAYAEAIALTPNDRSLWQAAAPAFVRADRGGELDALLWSLAQGSRDRALQSALWDHLAETRAERGELAGAIQAREAQLGASTEVHVLERLVDLLRQSERPADLARRLDELARRSGPEQARLLRLERAGVLAEKLNDAEAAKAELDRLLAEIAPDDAAALRMLIELCVATKDTARRASAQERLIKLAPSLTARVELAVELVDLYERELRDLEGAIRVLVMWTTLEPKNPQPFLRLVPLLTETGKRRELVDANDKLAALAMTDDEAGEFVLRAARVAIELQDYDGAWNRLVPRVVEKNELGAETLLRELSITAKRGEQLSALYVGLAQRAQDPQRERQRWSDAARVLEQQVGAPERALEAMLRALAKQLDSEELLCEVERLSERAGAWPRLGQVYDTLIRKAESTEARIGLLMRHAELLEKRGKDANAAFERVWLAYQLNPSRDRTYEEAKRLARATERRDELLTTFERRAQSNASVDARLDALLEACALAQQDFEDPARATGYLSRAVTLAGDTQAQLDMIEARVRAIDERKPPVHGRGLLAELASVYMTLAAENEKVPARASAWLARAAQIHEHTLDDPAAAFRSLERASTLVPGDDKLLDELHRVAGLANKWEALASHLQHTADVAIDSRSSSAALSRLGALYERELASPTRAADAYEQLVRLRPQDAEASHRLRTCLRAADRFEELLIAIDRELFMLKPEQGKRELLKQAAETWEFGLKNRYEALDAWRKVAALAPQDPEVVAALTRLRSRPRADDSLLDGDLVVRPEDLRPSLVGTPVSPEHFAAAEGEAQPVARFFGESDAEPRDGQQALDAVEPEEAEQDELSRLSGELGLPGEADALEDTSEATSRSDRIGAHAEGSGEMERVDAHAHAAEERPDATEEFDADMTIPLDHDDGDAELAELSLAGLSAVIEDRGAASSSPPPRPKTRRRRK